MSTDRRLLGRDYWLVLSTPAAGTGAADVARRVDEHLDWMLGLEAAGVIVMSGPLTEGPDVRPGSGVTVLRAQSAEHARGDRGRGPVRRGRAAHLRGVPLAGQRGRDPGAAVARHRHGYTLGLSRKGAAACT